MSSLWRVLALAWLGTGAPSAAEEPMFPDQIIARAAETDDRVLIAFDSEESDRPAVLYPRMPSK